MTNFRFENIITGKIIRNSLFRMLSGLCSWDARGRLWIGTVEGLLILQPDTKSISQYRFSYEDPSSLGHNSVRSLLRDHQGGMWVGTYHGGLNYYHVLAPDFSCPATFCLP